MPRPGEYATHLARERLVRALSLTLLASAAGVLCVQRGVEQVLAKDPVSLLMVAVAVAAGYASRTAWRSVSRAERGAASEKSVGKTLERAGLGTVLHGVDLDAGGDADHILIGHVAAVIETKTGEGQVRYGSDGMFAGQRRIPGDPVRQAQRQAAAMRRHTGVWTHAVVCVTGMTNAPFRSGETVVCSRRDLVAALRSLPATLEPHDAAVVVGALSRATGRT